MHPYSPTYPASLVYTCLTEFFGSSILPQVARVGPTEHGRNMFFNTVWQIRVGYRCGPTQLTGPGQDRAPRRLNFVHSNPLHLALHTYIHKYIHQRIMYTQLHNSNVYVQ